MEAGLRAGFFFMRSQIVAIGVLSLALARPFDSPKDTLAQGRPDILLITLDTVRADRMGFLGSTRGLTPQLDAFARDGMVFTRAYAQAPITTASHATMLTGTYPPFHRVSDFGSPLPATVPYLPDLLKGAGYRTAAFVGSLILDPRAGTAPGFDRGFDVYDAGFRLRQAGEDRYHTIERRGDDVVERAIRWLTTTRPTSPFFLWVHLYDAHDPYDPPADLRRRYATALYDGEVASVDRFAGRLLHGVGPDTLVVVAADHGEALGDHGEDTHGVFLYDATLHVPLVVRLPGRRSAGARVQARVRLADIAPTVMDAAGLTPPSTMEGESLLKGTLSDRPVYAETNYPRQAFGWSALASWRTDRFLFVRAPRRELYDELTDPGATKNLADTRSRVADGIDAELEQFVRRTGADDRGGRSSVDPALAERLASLGYVGGSGGSRAQPGVDPKDRIGVANTLHTAIVAVEDGAFRKAIPLLEQVTASEPTIQIAQLNLGVARARQRQYAAAIAPLRKAIAINPGATTAHYELGSALYETGDLKGAAELFAIVAARMPQWADARYSLGSVLARIDRVGEASAELRAAIVLEPRHFRANLLLGRILTLQDQGATAVGYLQTATTVQPASAEAHRFLADAYEKSGYRAEAAAERRRAQELTKK
jgi:arylsulfatase A-like enzyme/Flp pilus assembly protein TadD